MPLTEIAKKTLEIIETGTYRAPGGEVDVRRGVEAALGHTRLYTPSEVEALLPGPQVVLEGRAPATEVTPETTAEACRRLAKEGISDMLALNFASAKNPGGGFLRGAKAQEEDLARCSALYSCQLRARAYYDANRANQEELPMLYTDHLIYSPRVPFFRDESLELLDEPFFASIITSPAPNAGEVLRRDAAAGPRIREVLERRAAHVLAVARAHRHRTLVLGAWGCGVFRNDPVLVADVFAAHLASEAFFGAFERIVFAVYDRAKGEPNLRAFERRFA